VPARNRPVARRARRASAALDPTTLHHALSFDLVTSALRRRRRRHARILEVGCGSGKLARMLSRAGHRVTAIDASPDAVAAARRIGVRAEQADFLDWSGGPFDAVVFVLSLHHIRSLPRAIARARRVLAPGGLLIADEFGRERVDRATAAWFFQNLDLLDAAGLLRHEDPGPYTGPKHGHGRNPGRGSRGAGASWRAKDPRPWGAAGDPDPLTRWRNRHSFERRLHTARAMEAAIGARFELVSVQAGPHLFRYPSRRLEPGVAGVRIGRFLLDAERRLIAAGRLRAAGLKIVARRRPD
jgi:SAM-dependent methyltransferase